MAYTYDQLVQAYTAVNDGVSPDAATKATFQIQAVQSANGQLSDAQLLSNIVNSADSTTGLAVLAYQFFTGKSPTKAGIDYLVNSSANTADLNDPYYSKFSLENRYINFAANLGIQGEGAANFSAKYGALSFTDYVASIYQTIVGGSYAQAAGIDPAKAIADIVARKDAILATAQGAGMIPANATAAQIDLALKAATAGYLLGEAIKADVGLYAAATNNFMVAVAQGTATYNTDITLSYQPSVNTPSHGTGHTLDNAPPVLPVPAPPTQPTGPTGPVAHAFVLTGGNDTFTGESSTDTFVGTDTTFNVGDILNGGAGYDTLTITGATGGTYTPAAAAITSIETINITNNAGVVYNAIALTDVAQLTVNAVGLTTVTGASTTNVTLNVTGQGTSNVTANGGHDVTVNTTGSASLSNTLGSITVGSGLAHPTGAVTVNASNTGAGMAGTITVLGGTGNSVSVTSTSAGSYNTVAVYDVNGGSASTTVGKITTVSVDGYTVFGIQDNALSKLSLAHGSGNIIIDNSSSLASVSQTKTLNLSLNGLTGGTLDDADIYTTLNVTTVTANSTLANITDSALTTLNLAGTNRLTLVSTAGLSALQTVTVTGSASLVASFSSSNLTSINTSASTGASTINTSTMSNAITFVGGAGDDTITLNGKANTINVGTGSDRININVAPATGSVFTSITGMTHGTGDKISITSSGSAAPTTWNAAATPFNTDFATTLNDAAASATAGSTSVLHWFVVGGDTFIVQDNSNATTFVNGVDVVVKIVGVADLSTATVAGGVITI